MAYEAMFATVWGQGMWFMAWCNWVSRTLTIKWSTILLSSSRAPKSQQMHHNLRQNPTQPSWARSLSHMPHKIAFMPIMCWLGTTRDENGRENVLTIPGSIFFGREREQEWKGRSGKRNQNYSISGSKYFDRENVDYGRESVIKIGSVNTSKRFNHSTQ
jgi:glycerol-3-phosphate O-acyltransferase